MGRVFLALLSTLFLVTQVMAGTWTSNNFFYQPAIGGRGDDEKAKFDLGLNRVDARLANEKWLNDSAYNGDLNTAITAIGGAKTVLSIPAGNWPIAADLTVPANLRLKFAHGAVLTIPTGKTLTINGALEAGPYQIFSCTGTGKVVFTAGAVEQFYPEWWAANTTPGTTDMTAAILAAYTAAQDAGRGLVRLLPNQYAVADLVLPKNGAPTNLLGLTVAGSGQGTKIVPAAGHTSGNYLITLSGTHADATRWVTLRDFYVSGEGTRTKGIYVGPSSTCRLMDITIIACVGTGLDLERPYDLYADRVRVYGCGSYADSEAAVIFREDSGSGTWGNQVYWTDCNVEASAYRGMEIKGCSFIDWKGGKIHGKVIASSSESLELLYIDGGSPVNMTGVQFSHGHYADAIVITDMDGSLGGTELWSRVNFNGCYFMQMESHTPASFSMDVIKYDAGDGQSHLIVNGCYFDKSTGLGPNGRYIHITSSVANTKVAIGNNTWLEAADPTIRIQDDRTSAARELGGNFQYLQAWNMVLGGNTASGTLITLASDAITYVDSYCRVATEGGAGSDDLATINGGRIGSVLVLRVALQAQPVTVKHGTGNIWLTGKADFVLNSNKDILVLFNTDGATWVQIGGGDNG